MTHIRRLGAPVWIIGCMLLTTGGHAAPLSHFAQALMPVRLCTSSPVGMAGYRALTRGINNAVTLAGEQWKARFRTVRLQLLPPLVLDDAALDGSSPDPTRERRNARDCAAQSDTLGYIGPLNSAVAPYSMAVLNRAGMVQISPGNTFPTLTSPAARRADQPATYAHQIPNLTYYRTITTDALQGPSAAAYLKERLGATTYFLVDDQQQYGTGVAGAMRAYAQKMGLQLIGTAHLNLGSESTWVASLRATADLITAKHPDGVLYAGGTWYLGGPKVSLFKDLRRNGYTGPIVGVDSVVVGSIGEFTSSGERSLYATIPGPAPQTTSASFRRVYTHRFHTPVQQYDASAYDAANIVLKAIFQAATHGTLHGSVLGKRTAILPYVAHVHWKGALGVTSFDRNGDTRNSIVSVYRVSAGAWVYVHRAPPVRGVSPAG